MLIYVCSKLLGQRYIPRDSCRRNLYRKTAVRHECATARGLNLQITWNFVINNALITKLLVNCLYRREVYDERYRYQIKNIINFEFERTAFHLHPGMYKLVVTFRNIVNHYN